MQAGIVGQQIAHLGKLYLEHILHVLSCILCILAMESLSKKFLSILGQYLRYLTVYN